MVSLPGLLPGGPQVRFLGPATNTPRLLVMTQAFWEAALQIGFFFFGAQCMRMVVGNLSRGQ